MIDEEEEQKEQMKINQKLRAIDLSVNLILNKDDELMPEGYGDYIPDMNVEMAEDFNEDQKTAKNLKKKAKEDEENEKVLAKYNKYSSKILSNQVNQPLAVSSVVSYKEEIKERPSISHKNRPSNITPIKPKLSSSAIEANKMAIMKFSSQLTKQIDLSAAFPNPSTTNNYIESTTLKAYKTTLKVNSEDIESRIPRDILNQQHYYQAKHDKLLELFYGKLPVKSKEELQKLISMKEEIVKLGKEIQIIAKKMGEHHEFKKYL